MSKDRRCGNWLGSLAKLIEDTEAPRVFWLWAGVFTLSAALQRRVWLPFGVEPLYPNLYILLVAPPGRCRKGGPVSLARRMLHEVRIAVAVDSLTKRALTKEMAELGKSQYFQFMNTEGQQVLTAQTAISIVSKEFSSLLAADPKGMIECLTDLFDSHDKWAYKTSGMGEDFLYGVCINLLAATTPTWIAANLPEEAIGGGFTSRLIMVFADKKYRRISVPSPLNDELYQDLIRDLGRVAQLVGEFRWTEEAYGVYDEWYQKLGGIRSKVREEKLHAFVERMHIIAIKTAMALRVAYSDELIFTADDMGHAIELVNDILKSAHQVFAGHGRALTALDTSRIQTQIRMAGKITVQEILKSNIYNVKYSELREILQTLEASGHIKMIVSGTNASQDLVIWEGVKD